MIVITMCYMWSLHLASASDISTGDSSYTRADLGTIGDFIGGLLNPLLTFATVCLLIWSIRIQQKELSAATKVLKQTKDVHDKNIKNEEKNFIRKAISEDIHLIRLDIDKTFQKKQFKRTISNNELQSFSLSDLQCGEDFSNEFILNKKSINTSVSTKIKFNQHLLRTNFSEILYLLLHIEWLILKIDSEKLGMELFVIKLKLPIFELGQVLRSIRVQKDTTLFTELNGLVKKCGDIEDKLLDI